MGNFYRDDRSSGGWRGKKSFGNRDFDGPEMHQTVCSDCGNDCEVPFKPNGRKPVFCKSCFKKDEFGDAGDGRRDSGRDNRDSRDFGRDSRENRDYDRPRFEKPRFEKPRFEKPAFKEQGNSDQYKEQFERLNFKMDLILKGLQALGLKEPEAKAAKMAKVELPEFIKAVKSAKAAKVEEPKEEAVEEKAETKKEVKAKKVKKVTKKKAA